MTYPGVYALLAFIPRSATRAWPVVPNASATSRIAYIGGPTDHINGADALCGGGTKGL